jgi:hypothetical protein
VDVADSVHDDAPLTRKASVLPDATTPAIVHVGVPAVAYKEPRNAPPAINRVPATFRILLPNCGDALLSCRVALTPVAVTVFEY